MYQNVRYQIRAKRNRAINALNKLKVDNKLIEEFDIHKSPVLFDINNLPYSLSLNNEPELYQIIKNFERKTDCLVYAVIREVSRPYYKFLIISNKKEDWGEEVELPYVYAYTYYKRNPDASEFGCVEVYFKENRIINVCEANYFNKRIG